MKRKLLVLFAVLVATACTSQSDSMSDELRNDLDVAASSDGLALASGNGQTQQVVSAVEQAPPAPRKVAASQRAVRPRRAETPTPAPVESEAAEPSTETVEQDVTNAPVATDDAPPVAPRPTPVMTSMPGGNDDGRIGSGVGVGIGVGIGTIIGVVLRGGSAGEDHCEPPGRNTRSRPTIAVNSRIPVIRGTYPRR